MKAATLPILIIFQTYLLFCESKACYFTAAKFYSIKIRIVHPTNVKVYSIEFYECNLAEFSLSYSYGLRYISDRKFSKQEIDF